MRTYHLDLVKDYSRLDSQAQWLIDAESKEFISLNKAKKILRKINLKLGSMLGKKDYLPRIDILDNEGKRYKWGDL